MMIGGGGSSCSRADHGIGITETAQASFVEAGGSKTEYDFGYDAKTVADPSKSYSSKFVDSLNETLINSPQLSLRILTLSD